MKDKGFTLIELFAVIVILAVILLLLAPRVNSIIYNVKLNAFLNDEQYFVKATKNYIATKEQLLPLNIGDTAEISLDDLINNGFIEAIKSPLDNNTECNGYVIITKIKKNDYQYTPHLNCFNDIDDSLTDGLISHWRFDDFQEPTENYIANGHFANGENVVDEWDSNPLNEIIKINNPGNSSWALKQTAVGGIPNNEYEIHFKINKVIEKDSSYTMSCWVAYTPEWDGNNQIFHSRTYYTDSTDSTTGGNGNKLNSVIIDNLTWENRYLTFNTYNKDVLNTENYEFNWYVGYSANNTAGYRYITNLQVEKKPYATPYTETFREGIIKDNSGNNNHIILNTETTPRWINNCKIGEGCYKFDGIKNYIEITDDSESILGDNPDEWSYSFWFKKEASGFKKAFISNYDSETADDVVGIWAGINNTFNDGKIFIVVRGINAPNYLFSSNDYNYNDNMWHQITVSVKKGDYVKGYIDGVEFANSALGNEDYIDNAPLRIGVLRSNGALGEFLDGYIDDVIIYNRSLTANEIKFNYNVEKQ